MNQVRCWVVLFAMCSFTTFGAAQKKICIGAISGGDAPMWNIQQPLLKAISTEATNLGTPVSTELLTNGSERAARGEISSFKCDYSVMTNVSREWPQPKSGGGINAGGGGGGGKDDNPHPPSTARFHFTLLDKSAKRIDKFDTSIEMQQGYTAKDVDPDLKQIIQEVANWVVDGTSAAK